MSTFLSATMLGVEIGNFVANPPKGQIEPNKEIQAEILAIDNSLKSRQEAALEHGRDFSTIVKDLADEKSQLEDAGLDAGMVEPTSIEEIEDDDEGNQNQTNQG
jgi:capsid protein